jgi:hypothetical protein
LPSFDRVQFVLVDADDGTYFDEWADEARAHDVARLGDNHESVDLGFGKVDIFSRGRLPGLRQGSCWVESMNEPLLTEDTIALAPRGERLVDSSDMGICVSDHLGTLRSLPVVQPRSRE